MRILLLQFSVLLSYGEILIKLSTVFHNLSTINKNDAIRHHKITPCSTIPKHSFLLAQVENAVRVVKEGGGRFKNQIYAFKGTHSCIRVPLGRLIITPQQHLFFITLAPVPLKVIYYHQEDEI